jgi:predicted membrane protein
MRLSKIWWFRGGITGVVLFFTLMFIGILSNAEVQNPAIKALVGVIIEPAYFLLLFFQISHAQPWIIYVFFFGTITNFCLGAAIGYLVQLFLRKRDVPRR